MMGAPLDDHRAKLRARLDHWKNRLRAAAPFAGGAAAAFAALFVYRLLFPPQPPLTARDVDESIARAMASATAPAAFSQRVYAVVQPSLVLIETEIPAEDGTVGEGLGSGVVIDLRGDILTSLHVIAEADRITVTFADGSKSAAYTVAEQPENDIAVLQAFQVPVGIVPATLGNPSSVRIGDEAFAVGNPFGLTGSMSAGVISGLDRTYDIPGTDRTLQGLIQIDAAVNPGNSGGPLLDRDGYVIGIVTGIVNPTDQGFFVGIGFAVPITSATSSVGGPRY
jgi:S1-C subfamily serine protease